MEPREGILFCLGNLLLDITAVVEPEFLMKYNLLPNNSTLAQAANVAVYDEIQPIDFSAGGSALNTLRIIQRILNMPKATTLMGAIGKDENAEKLVRSALRDGINVKYQEVPDLPTGRCAVLINGVNRSLLTQLGAAQRFSTQHLLSPENFSWVEAAKFYYITGYFLVASSESVQEICNYSHVQNRQLLLNISATWVTTLCTKALTEMIPYVDVIFGNEQEIRSFGEITNFGSDIFRIARALSNVPKLSTQKFRERIVVITRGSRPVLVFEGQKHNEYPVVQLPFQKIIDTNGTGDAFVGGFLAEFIREKSVDDCVNKGIWAATHVLQQRGCHLPQGAF